MAGYASAVAEYDFDRFTSHEKASVASVAQQKEHNSTAKVRAIHTAASAAPAKKPSQPKHNPNLKKVPPKSKSRKNSEIKMSFRKSLSLAILAAVVLLGIGNQITVGAEKYRLSRQIAVLESRLQIEKSENIRLNSELNGITSIGRIDEYAEKILGMVNAESYQVECIDLSHGDAVLFAHGQTF